MKKTRMIVLFVVCGLALLVASIYAIATNSDSIDTASRVGSDFGQILTNENNSTVAAEINGIPVTKAELAFRRYVHSVDLDEKKKLTKHPLADVDEQELLLEIAKEQFVMERAKEYGIDISKEEIMDQIRAEEAYVQQEIENGNELMMQRQKEDEAFLESLGMSREQYYEEIYLKMLRYSRTLTDFAKFYYSNLSRFPEHMSFEQYLDEEFRKAPLEIVVKN